MQFLLYSQKNSLTSLCDYNVKNSEKWQTKKKGTVVLCVCKIGVSSLKCHYNIRLTWRAVICWGKSTCYDAEDRHWREVTAELSWSEKHILQVFIKINGKFMCKKIILSPVAACLHAIQTLTKRRFIFFIHSWYTKTAWQRKFQTHLKVF